MPSNVVSLADFKKAKERKKYVRGPPKSWQVMSIEAIPVQKKGIVSQGQLHCPICGAICYGLGPPEGRGHRKFRRVYSPCCGFSCDWRGVNHMHYGAPVNCPGCAQNPIAFASKDIP